LPALGVSGADSKRKEIAMEWEQIQGKWNQLKGSARVEWAKLTDDELEQVQGERDKLVGLIQEKYGRTKEEAYKEVDDWAGRA